ncbi:YbjN domain-containing protein [Cyanobacterium sp. Dongsha4]|uniref:YbjN domain-containing protein n=1 Tax=Cyanobacterium sp. DS4 TaxID=2878255 RepID=UPI000F1837E5|nr:YbjN domain-containing protein [Cyanobacterium sp. Dongsha4]RMD69253.1 MAG: YbjN domain-containing protein [Cyanobacteria bacterium J149]WVL01522.1 YbjN domain-containing protein [Cyanobacterium sp. Dongsha4]
MTTPELEINQEFSDLEDFTPSKISHKDEIETVIYSLEENDSAMVQKTDEGYIWKFQYGTVEVFVQLTGETDEDLFTVWSVVLPLPAKNEAELMRVLLEMNWSGTFETNFGIFNNQIVLSTQRTVDDLSASEISRAITLVATLADEYDEELQSKYL